MALENVKLRVQAKDDDKIRCFIAESITSFEDIHDLVRRYFDDPEIDVLHICYKG